MAFAHMKRNLNFHRLRLRGIKSANDECVLVATVQNLRKLAKYRGQPPPKMRISEPEIQALVQKNRMNLPLSPYLSIIFDKYTKELVGLSNVWR